MGNEKAGAEERVFVLRQLMQLHGDVDVTEDVVKDIEIEGIDCGNWDRDEAVLLKVPKNHINDILHECHDSKITGHWGREKTQELDSRNFT